MHEGQIMLLKRYSTCKNSKVLQRRSVLAQFYMYTELPHLLSAIGEGAVQDKSAAVTYGRLSVDMELRLLATFLISTSYILPRLINCLEKCFFPCTQSEDFKLQVNKECTKAAWHAFESA